MENTSKALLITAIILIIIIIVALGIKIFSSSSKTAKVATDLGSEISEKIDIVLGKTKPSASSSISEGQVPIIDVTDSNNEETENMSLQQGQTAVENSPYISDGKKAIIPAGFTVSNIEGETSIDNGLVIRKDENEWVWIPVSAEDLSRMYTESDIGWKMSGTDIITKYKSNYDLKSGGIRANPGEEEFKKYKEPDVLTSKNTGDLHCVENISYAGLGNNISEMATILKNDYRDMIDSIKKYGGFYVARYEISNSGIKKGQSAIRNQDWYYFYKKCKEFCNDSVESRMLWGCQWDLICMFISNYGDRVDLNDSREYGNYSNAIHPIEKNMIKKFLTGANEFWKTNNIYDLAGNSYEWTQEAFSSTARILRGGSSGTEGINYSVISKTSFCPTYDYPEVSTRPTLYIK